MPYENIYTGYRQRGAEKQQEQMQNLQSFGMAQGVLERMRKTQEQAAIKAALAGAPDLKSRIDALEKIGTPMAYEVAKGMMATQGERLKMEQAARGAAFRDPKNLAQFMTGGQPAQPEESMPEGIAGPPTPARAAVPGQIDPHRLLAGAASAGIVDPLAYAKERIAENKPQFAPSRSSGYFQGGKFTATPENQPALPQSPLAKLLAEKAALAPNDPRHRMYDAAITHATNPQEQRIIIPPSEPPVQTYTDGQGVLWERPRGGAWKKATFAPGQGEMTPKPQVAGAKAAMKFSEQAQTLDAITRQIDELDAHISKNEGLVSGTVGPRGLANRLYEVGAGTVGVDVPTPALETQSKKELLIANIRKMVAGSGVFTNKDADRIDAAIGVGIMANPSNTKKALADLRTFVNEKRTAIQASTNVPASGKAKAEDFFR